MVYFMRYLKKNRALFFLFCCLLFSGFLFSEEKNNDIKISNFNFIKTGKLYLVSFNQEFFFTDKIMEAIKKGIPFAFNIEIKVIRKFNFFWDQNIAKDDGEFEISYKSLRKVYIVKDINDERKEFRDITEALKYLSHIHKWSVELEIPDNQKDYFLILQIKLNRKKLPKPLQVDFFGKSWNIESDVFEYPLGILR